MIDWKRSNLHDMFEKPELIRGLFRIAGLMHFWLENKCKSTFQISGEKSMNKAYIYKQAVRLIFHCEAYKAAINCSILSFLDCFDFLSSLFIKK